MHPSHGSDMRPSFAVIFSSQHAALTSAELAEYEATAKAMVELASQQPGFLGVESARNPDGSGITVSYWDSLEAVASWKAVAEHRKAQDRGRETFYSRYEIRVCSVLRRYELSRDSKG